MKQISVIKQNYVHPEVFHHEIKKCQHFNELSDDLIDMFHLTVKNVSAVYKDDPRKDQYAIGAFSECVKNWRNFKPEISNNPSIYFRNVAKNGFMKISNTKS